MKKAISAIAVLSLAASVLLAQESHLRLRVPDFTVLDMNSQQVRYSMLENRPTVVIFFSTRCPMSNAFNFRRNELYLNFRELVNFIVLDSNRNESVEEIRNYARQVEFDFPVYKDVDNVVADRFGAQVTTDTYVIDSSGVIRYHGYLEDSPNPTRAKIQGLRLAIRAVLEGKPVELPETKVLGCTIRRAQP